MSKAMFARLKRNTFVAVSAGLLLGPSLAFAEYKLNFPEPITTLGKEIYDLHMLTTGIITVIMIFIVGMMTYSMFMHRKSRGFVADQKLHLSKVSGYSWLIVTSIVFVLDVAIAVPAGKTLASIETYEPGDVTLKITGSQWKWTYEYINDGVEDGQEDNLKFTANITPEEEAGEHWLRDTDKRVVLPINKRIRILQTASDVMHAWWVPAIAYKKDAIPGYINETWAVIEKTGVYRGQCAELCGKGHAYMPIVIESVSPEDYETWVAKAKQDMASASQFAMTGWTKVKLMETGKKIYDANCASCHQPTGEGVAGLFPALKGSEVVSERDHLGQHLKTVLDGRPGTPMPAWGPQLNDLEIAATITYERNSWGNDTGDVIQPADVQQARTTDVAKEESHEEETSHE